MAERNGAEAVRSQYSAADKLKIRAALHSKYSSNRQGFGNWITAQYEIAQGACVLELGCGTGEMWLGRDALIEGCGRLVLSDLSEGMLQAACEKLRDASGIEFMRIDAQSIPFPDGAFDVVIANMMLYHLPDRDRGLREIRRVLRPGGVFYCATFGENGILEHIYKLLGISAPGARGGFTLQNGAAQLGTHFSRVRQLLYDDSLIVTNIDDLLDYIYSLDDMTPLRAMPRAQLGAALEAKMTGSALHIPKEYGMFICS